jgi:predicted O-methyltransferase YrrM
MLEIGSFEGRSTVWFLDNVLTHPSATIVCVDTFEFGHARFDHNISVSGFAEKVRKLKGSSDLLIPSLPLESFDIVYVDGDHHAPNVLMDGVLSWYRLKPGGVMIFDDDWMDKLPDSRPQMAIDLFLKLFEGRHEILLRENDQVIVWKCP